MQRLSQKLRAFFFQIVRHSLLDCEQNLSARACGIHRKTLRRAASVFTTDRSVSERSVDAIEVNKRAGSSISQTYVY